MATFFFLASVLLYLGLAFETVTRDMIETGAAATLIFTFLELILNKFIT